MKVLSTKGISKQFGDYWANKDINIYVNSGEIISLLGENGAGKTTLMNILYGLYQPTKGSILIKEEECRITCPKNASDLGISMVHQHFMLVDSLTVVENIIIGNEPTKRFLIDMQFAKSKVEMLSDKYKLNIKSDSRVGDLSVGEKQRIELLKALYNDCDILILDEPTAVLTPEEVGVFFETLKSLSEAGKSIILISHKLQESMNIANRIYIMRRGEIVAETTPKETSTDNLAEMMVGRSVQSTLDKQEMKEDAETLLELKNVELIKGKKKIIENVNLNLHSGRILGIAGVDGNGQTELVESIIGIRKISSGSIMFGEKEISGMRVKEHFEFGIAYIPEDRMKNGLVGSFNLMENLILGYHNDKRFALHKQIRWSKVNKYAKDVIKNYDIRCQNEMDHAISLSGGNQQKLIIGRVLESDPTIIIAAQPTRGVDIGAIENIHRRLLEMRNTGKGILLVSADLDEILKLSDDIAVMYEGKIVSIFENGYYNKTQIGSLMTGAVPNKGSI